LKAKKQEEPPLLFLILKGGIAVKILVLNCGSSSVKFQLFNTETEESLVKGIVEEIGSEQAIARYAAQGRPELKEIRSVPDHEHALDWVISTLLHPEHGVIKDVNDIAGVGHRVVHGGEKFSGSVLITEEVIKKMEECSDFAPLHNPPNLVGIAAARNKLPHAVQAGVFDTAFHQQMNPVSYLYGIPYELYKDYGIRRYGFHGTSHFYVSRMAAEYLKRPVEDLKLVTCHLGNGASMAAVKYGVSIDTTMGFTPVEGLLMGTRCGDIDPYIVLYTMEKKGLTAEGMSSFMNKQCGLKGLSGVTSDMREIVEGMEKGSERHRLAFEIFCWRVRKYIGAYAFAMGGLDAVIFTGGIGENAWQVRREVLSGLDFFGIVLDEEKNSNRSTLISKGSVKVLVIPTNEELVIARETRKFIQSHIPVKK
jgi:acetate kinase